MQRLEVSGALRYIYICMYVYIYIYIYIYTIMLLGGKGLKNSGNNKWQKCLTNTFGTA
jgi:hypothetical protein